MSLTLCVQLWAVPGNEEDLVSYEDEVLSLLGDHGARLLQRVRTVEHGDGPYEVHIIEFPDENAMAEFMADPRRLVSVPLRDRSVARTEITAVAQI